MQGNGIGRRTAIIIGAGRIGRGFVAEIFNDAGYHITFVDIDRKLVDDLNEHKKYNIIKCNRESTHRVSIQDFDALHTSQEGEISELLSRPDAIVGVAVHAHSIPEVAQTLALGIARRAMEFPDSPLDIIMCVNTVNPAKQMRTSLEYVLGGSALDFLEEKVGLIDTVVPRMATDPPQEMLKYEPLATMNNGFPYMVADETAFKSVIPQSSILQMTRQIHAVEVRKIYTANMCHATLAYLGAARNYYYSVDAIRDPEIKKVIDGVIEESSFGLCNEFGFDEKEMKEWCFSVVDMLDNPMLKDTLERLGSDTARKLAVGDRLVGPAMLCLKAGRYPENLVNAIAHGYLFNLSEDPGTEKVLDTVKKRGIVSAIEILSGIDIKHPLQSGVLEAYYTAKDKLEEIL
ncbi:MAG: hypothetical protein E7334_00340 [Clostridiales bacterium]|nr:hypothetical protein [Clostridiales bacterium]MBQ2818431.1 hypothetical protein [Clostridia bacterium]MBQ4638179.1 hypothetical protein [Clostridia bacterium]